MKLSSGQKNGATDGGLKMWSQQNFLLEASLPGIYYGLVGVENELIFSLKRTTETRVSTKNIGSSWEASENQLKLMVSSKNYVQHQSENSSAILAMGSKWIFFLNNAASICS